MALDYIAIAISGFALLISALSYRNSQKSGSRQWRLEARRLAAQLKIDLEKLDDTVEQSQIQATYYFARHGSINSSNHDWWLEEIEKKASKRFDLRVRLDKAMIGIEKQSDSALEETLVTLKQIQTETHALAAWLAENDFNSKH